MPITSFPTPPEGAPAVPENYVYIGMPDNFSEYHDQIAELRGHGFHVLWLYDPRNTRYPDYSYLVCRQWKKYGMLHDRDAHYCIHRDSSLYSHLFSRIWQPNASLTPTQHDF